MFQVNAASFAINGKTLLEPTDLRFDEGRVYGLIGHNGSGKSTLLKLLAQQQGASQGDIQLDGRPLASWGNREFARQVAYLPQQLPGAEALTGRELVAFGRYPWHGLLGRMSDEDRRQIEHAIALTHTEAFADRLVALLTACATLVAGPLSFVGLLAPHMARLMGFKRARDHLLGATLIGATLLGGTYFMWGLRRL